MGHAKLNLYIPNVGKGASRLTQKLHFFVSNVNEKTVLQIDKGIILVDWQNLCLILQVYRKRDNVTSSFLGFVSVHKFVKTFAIVSCTEFIPMLKSVSSVVFSNR